MLRMLSSLRPQLGSRVLFLALVLFGGGLIAAAAPPDREKPNAKESPASFRAYLPTIRLKALRDNERQAVADLEEWLGRYEVYLEGGLVNLAQRGQLEEEYHRSRLRALRLDMDYRDSLDQYTSRSRDSEERRRLMEDAAIKSILKVFQRFEELSRNYESALNELSLCEDTKDVAKLRPGLIKLLTESALVKNTSLPKRFLKQWDEWKKINDKNEAMDRILKNRKDFRKFRTRQYELAEKQQTLPEADRQRMGALKFEIDVCEFQLALLYYEEQPWKKDQDEARRAKHRREMLDGIGRSVTTLLDYSYVERQTRLAQSWPRMAPVKVKDMDLLAGEPTKAERTVTSLLKAPDAQLAGKKKVRRIRTLSESYPIQQRLFYLAFVLRENLKTEQNNANKPPPGGDVILPGLVGPVGRRPSFDDRPYAPEAILKREIAIKQARRQLLRTWIDYQMLRLDLYNALGIAPPER